MKNLITIFALIFISKSAISQCLNCSVDLFVKDCKYQIVEVGSGNTYYYDGVAYINTNEVGFIDNGVTHILLYSNIRFAYIGEDRYTPRLYNVLNFSNFVDSVNSICPVPIDLSMLDTSQIDTNNLTKIETQDSVRNFLLDSLLSQMSVTDTVYVRAMDSIQIWQQGEYLFNIDKTQFCYNQSTSLDRIVYLYASNLTGEITKSDTTWFTPSGDITFPVLDSLLSLGYCRQDDPNGQAALKKVTWIQDDYTSGCLTGQTLELPNVKSIDVYWSGCDGVTPHGTAYVNGAYIHMDSTAYGLAGNNFHWQTTDDNHRTPLIIDATQSQGLSYYVTLNEPCEQTVICSTVEIVQFVEDTSTLSANYRIMVSDTANFTPSNYESYSFDYNLYITNIETAEVPNGSNVIIEVFGDNNDLIVSDTVQYGNNYNVLSSYFSSPTLQNGLQYFDKLKFATDYNLLSNLARDIRISYSITDIDNNVTTNSTLLQTVEVFAFDPYTKFAGNQLDDGNHVNSNTSQLIGGIESYSNFTAGYYCIQLNCNGSYINMQLSNDPVCNETFVETHGMGASISGQPLWNFLKLGVANQLSCEPVQINNPKWTDINTILGISPLNCIDYFSPTLTVHYIAIIDTFEDSYIYKSTSSSAQVKLFVKPYKFF